MANGQAATVQSVARAFAILEVMAEHDGQATLSELSESMGIAMPTVHRLVRSLVSLGYVRQLPSRRYALGPGLIRLGEKATLLLAAWAKPMLEELERAAQETANLAILDGDMAVYVAQVPSRHQMRMFTEVGRRVHTHSTGVGKALLSQLSNEQVLSIVRRAGLPKFTETTHTSQASLLADLDEIRGRGYAIDEGEQEVGVRCFAVPVVGTTTPTAVSVSGPDARLTLATAEWLVPALARASQQLAGPLDADLLDREPRSTT